MNKRKYEIIAWLFVSLLTGFTTYSTYLDYVKPIKVYPIAIGKILNVEICQSETTAMIRGVSTKIHSDVLCFDLGKNKQFHIFKTNKKYSKILSKIKLEDNVKVSYSDQYNDESFTTIQIVKDEEIIYSYDDRKKQEKIELFMLIGATLFFLFFGIGRHYFYLKSIQGFKF